ncbi:MAG: GAF domain-containing protein [Symploca sp. SIO1C2]|nr:GAF domain-containing protein [Symploca sp. SIO1C2]
MPYLIKNPDATNPEIHQLKPGVNTIGRELDNSIIVADRSLSRHHAEIMIAEERAIITDLGSLNNTFVNEYKIDECELNDGDWVRYGAVVFLFVERLKSPKPETLGGEGSSLSIIGRLTPEKTRVALQDLLDQQSSQQQGTVLMLRQQSAEQRALDKLKILLEVSQQLSSPEEPQKLLDKILDLLLQIMNVDRAIILMLNQKTGELEQKAVKFRDGIPNDGQIYSTTITNFVYENGEAILISDACVDNRFYDANSILAQAIRSSMCVPLKPRERVIGVLYADNLSMVNVYRQEDLEFLTALANQAAIAIENAKLYKQIEAEAVMRAKFESFFPEAVSKKLKEEGQLKTVDTEVTALFADISRFTQICSRMEPRQVIEMLNEYFQVMVEDIVFKYEGTLEQYIGDGLLAIWGAPYRQTDDAKRAVQAAIEMQRAVGRLNRDWAKRRNLQIKIHIGLNTGKVAAGNIGSPQLIQYGTIGDTTNLASRICDVAKGGEILISNTTLNQLSDRTIPVVKIPPVRVKGKQQPLQLYRVLY